ncbi:hypothetical protein [Clostridium sp. UBA6640]|uniref:hypothetical protein n=1 Tax=Clostridium sp. UBA6640 TaxID=1946370 RepID=UPI0025BD5CB5|nr:hypothetical protein [Clostridium sp. UBA6640]
MKKNKKLMSTEVYDMNAQESNEYLYYIAGYTSNGTPFGITWEEAIKDGLVENSRLNNDTDDSPF